jgi:hypothetical protein
MPLTTGHVALALFVTGMLAVYVYFMWAQPIMNLKDKKGSVVNNSLVLTAAIFILLFIVMAIMANLAEKSQN